MEVGSVVALNSYGEEFIGPTLGKSSGGTTSGRDFVMEETGSDRYFRGCTRRTLFRTTWSKRVSSSHKNNLDFGPVQCRDDIWEVEEKVV